MAAPVGCSGKPRRSHGPGRAFHQGKARGGLVTRVGVARCDTGKPRASQGYRRPRGRMERPAEGLGVHHMALAAHMQSRWGSH